MAHQGGMQKQRYSPIVFDLTDDSEEDNYIQESEDMINFVSVDTDAALEPDENGEIEEEQQSSGED